MMAENKAPTDQRWIPVNEDGLVDFDLKKGLYWVVIEGDYETGEAGSVVYEYDAYITTFLIIGFDEETGIPWGNGTTGDEVWESVENIWQAPVFKPDMPE